MRLEPAEETERATDSSSLLAPRCPRREFLDPREDVFMIFVEAVPAEFDTGAVLSVRRDEEAAAAAVLSVCCPTRSLLDSLRNKVDIFPVNPCLGRGG